MKKHGGSPSCWDPIREIEWMKGLGRLRGGSKAHGNIHSQKPGVDLTGTVEQGNDFFLKVTPSIKYAYSNQESTG